MQTGQLPSVFLHFYQSSGSTTSAKSADSCSQREHFLSDLCPSPGVMASRQAGQPQGLGERTGKGFPLKLQGICILPLKGMLHLLKEIYATGRTPICTQRSPDKDLHSSAVTTGGQCLWLRYHCWAARRADGTHV